MKCFACKNCRTEESTNGYVCDVKPPEKTRFSNRYHYTLNEDKLFNKQNNCKDFVEKDLVCCICKKPVDCNSMLPVRYQNNSYHGISYPYISVCSPECQKKYFEKENADKDRNEGIKEWGY